MAQETKIDSLVQSLHDIAKQDDGARGDVLDALRQLQRTIATRDDICNHFEQLNLELPVSRIAQDLKIYQVLSKTAKPINVTGLASTIGAAPLLTRRILRYLASVGQIDESGSDLYTANARTRVLAEDGFRGFIYHMFDNCGPPLQAFPAYLAETKYQDIQDAAKTPAQKAFNTPLPMFAYLPSFPERFEPLQHTMTIQPQGKPWFTVFPFTQELGTYSGSDVLVDVGGGFGHQCQQLLDAHPELKNKLVLQDLEQTLAMMPPLDGIKTMAHDFFTEQPIKGARFYYLRYILHDWPDDKCLVILGQLKAALGPQSQLLIDDIVMPEVGAHEQATVMDMLMMCMLGSIERTVNDWHLLLNKAGFKIERIDTYLPRLEKSIIQAVPL